MAFASESSLVSDDSNEQTDIYVYDSDLNQLSRVSVGPGGQQATGSSYTPSISGDGGVVAFASGATNLTLDTGLSSDASQIFVWERATGSVRLVSIGVGGAAGSGNSSEPSVSLDGRMVAFGSVANDLVDDDTNGAVFSPFPGSDFSFVPATSSDVFLRDIVRNVTIRVSVDGNGGQVVGDSGRPSVSGDGRTTAFDSTADTLVPGDTNEVRDVFVRDLPPIAQLAPNPLDFGTIALGTPSAPLTVTVTNAGWGPLTIATVGLGGANPADFALAGDACSGTTLHFGDTCPIGLIFTPSASGERTASLIVIDNAAGSPHSVILVGRGSKVTFRVDPPLGPPGFVTTAIGEGFPPGALVALRWDRGITATMQPIVVGPDGSFKTGVLIFHNDVEGARKLRASSAGGTPFTAASASFLVVIPTGQPPAFGAIRYLAPGLEPIVIRR